MTRLIKAILDSDSETVRKLLKSSTALINQRTELGDLPIDLAKKKGLKRIEVLFVKYTDWTSAYSKEELKELLVDFISELSQDYFAAGWLNGIEFDTWDLISKGIISDAFSLVTLSEDLDTIEDLKSLSNITGTWAIWDEAVGDAIPIEMDDWKQKIKN